MIYSKSEPNSKNYFFPKYFLNSFRKFCSDITLKSSNKQKVDKISCDGIPEEHFGTSDIIDQIMDKISNAESHKNYQSRCQIQPRESQTMLIEIFKAGEKRSSVDNNQVDQIDQNCPSAKNYVVFFQKLSFLIN